MAFDERQFEIIEVVFKEQGLWFGFHDWSRSFGCCFGS